jgi:hypothetical protein
MNTAESESMSAHRLALARELLEDIEMSRLQPESPLLKAARLARLVDAPEIQEWINLELKGYLNPVTKKILPNGLKHAQRTGRTTETTVAVEGINLKGYWQPYAGLLAWIQAMETEITSLRVPNIHYAPSSSNPTEHVGGMFGANIMAVTKPVHDAMSRMQWLTSSIAEIRGVASQIMALLHDFIAESYYALAFKGVAESIFESLKKEADLKLAQAAGDVLEKIPAIVERLSANDPEAISHAMSSGRRVLSAFADSVQPPTDDKLPYGTEMLEATSDKYLNRLRYFIRQRCKSDRREERLKHALVDLNTRFSAGTHSDVTAEEARALFVILYVTLGELMAL